MTTALVTTIRDDQAKLNITWEGQNGELPDAVPASSSDEEVKRFAEEAVRGGDVPGISADPNADFSSFVVRRYEPEARVPYLRFFLQPKTQFGIAPKW